MLGGLRPQAFLREYWQRRPLLVRGAFQGQRNPLSPEELAGLACETELPARLVLEHGGAYPWEVRHGPFAAEDFSQLPHSHWTLLVQGVERLNAAVAALRNPLDFLPAWRLDDIMVSYATDGGGVGPHVDSYDVFLVQLWGRRRWRVHATPQRYTACVPGLDLRILSEFSADQDWLLEPGDLLYLPPGVAHWGTAEGECMTYSIGFRAPSGREVWTGYLEHILAGLQDGGRYADPDLTPTQRPGEICKTTLARVQALLESMPKDPQALANWFGEHVTDPGPGFPEPGRAPQVARLVDRLREGRSRLYRRHGARLAYVVAGRETHWFALGQRWVLRGNLARLARGLADSPAGTLVESAPWLAEADGPALLATLVHLQALSERRVPRTQRVS